MNQSTDAESVVYILEQKFDSLGCRFCNVSQRSLSRKSWKSSRHVLHNCNFLPKNYRQWNNDDISGGSGKKAGFNISSLQLFLCNILWIVCSCPIESYPSQNVFSTLCGCPLHSKCVQHLAVPQNFILPSDW